MNTLFPVFLKLDHLNLLIVGGGYVGTEKALAVFKNNPSANVTLVAPFISDEIRALASSHTTFNLIESPYDKSHLKGMNLVIVGTATAHVQEQVWKDAKQKGLLVNVADCPDKCDFYLSSVVQKGDLKIAISTNGKSPTFAKRLREFFEDTLPNDIIQETLDNLSHVRDSLKHNHFEEKLEKLRDITKTFRKETL